MVLPEGLPLSEDGVFVVFALFFLQTHVLHFFHTPEQRPHYLCGLLHLPLAEFL